jgi:exodeoxyribonuclease VII large subunit
VDESLTPSLQKHDLTPRVWAVGALCRAIADALQARFNPAAVRGEISGFTRASSGHCYFTLKDAQGQIRCAMFRRAAQLLDFMPKDGELVEVQGRLGVYEPRGELQLVVESLRRAGQGALFEQFLQRKARLEAQGLFDPARKRPLPTHPKGIGIVTSLGAAALHDVTTALMRRVPHIPVIVAPAAVQGAQAAPALVQALQALGAHPQVEVILLVRGGGSMEDLWAFNDEALAHAIVASPKPVISGVGHETDFTIADFCADLRAPTPTAAAELCAPPREDQLDFVQALAQSLSQSVQRHLERQAQRLDRVQDWLARPAQMAHPARMKLQGLQQRMQWRVHQQLQQARQRNDTLGQRCTLMRQTQPTQSRQRLERAALRLSLLDPQLVLERGYAWLGNAQGEAIASVTELSVNQTVHATLADGMVDLSVTAIRGSGIS